MKVECDDWYGRNLDAKQREDSLQCIDADKRLALVEEELAETNKKLIELKQEQSKDLAETNKKFIKLKQEQSKELAEQSKELAEQSKELAEQSKELAEQSKELAEQSKELAETNKKFIKLKQEQSKPVTQSIKGKY